MKKFLIIFCLFLPFLPSCATAPLLVSPIITGIIMWKDGEARKYYNEEISTMYRATKISLKELDHPLTKDELNSEGHYIIAGEKDKFKIIIRQVKPNITEIRVRVNFMGDKPYAELLYNQIDANTNTIEFDDNGNPTKLRNKSIIKSKIDRRKF